MQLLTQISFVFLTVLCLSYEIEDTPFRVYWNVPSQACHQYGVYFNLSQYNIIQNTNDNFYGDKVSIFYGPGAFPHFSGAKSINGGIPQKANLGHHIASFRAKVLHQIPMNFSGVAILDFEDYEPSLQLAPGVYKHYSYLWAKVRNAGKSDSFIQEYSKLYFNLTSKYLFKILTMEGRKLRPGALWGYYGYPYCLNYDAFNLDCKPKQLAANEDLLDLFSTYGAYFPSIYVFKKGWNTRTRCLQASSRIKEAKRIKELTNNTQGKIFPYFWFRYHEVDEYLASSDTVALIGATKTLGADGIVIWGSSSDVNSKTRCDSLKKYIEDNLGPLLKRLTTESEEVNCNHF